MHAPGEAVARGSREQLVFLGVVEILHAEAGLLLAERRLRQDALSVRLERPEIMLQPGHERDVTRAVGLAEAVEQVADHRRVDPDVLGFGRLPQPGRDEHRVRLLVAEGGFRRRRIE